MFSTTQKIGMLGGGQLGKMLALAAANWDYKVWCLDPSAEAPAALVCAGFTCGDFKDFDTVMAFGADKDIITIEIEHVNTEALKKLEEMGKTVHPRPAALEIIQDKGLQKQFYREHDIPTAEFALFDDEKALKAAVDAGEWKFPFVQKTRLAGYDGKGVSILRNAADLETKLLPGPCLAEALTPIQTEIAVIAARNANDEVAVFPAVEMDFHPEANLVEFLLCPARIPSLAAAQAEALAERVIRAFDVCGLLAVEMFLTTDGEILVNEVAPRPHNSGHHTIDSAHTNQFEQHLRAISALPLGATAQKTPTAIMLNLLGEAGHKGPVRYTGAESCLHLEGVHIHLYGKALTSPFRKMGHVTITGDSVEAAMKKAEVVKTALKVVSE